MKCRSAAFLVVILVLLCGCYERLPYNATVQSDAERHEEVWAEAARVQAEDAARREKAWAEADAQLARQEELLKRSEALLSKKEEQAKRFDAILDRWESMPTEKSQ